MSNAYEAPSKTLPRISIKFECSGNRYTVTFGRFDDGRPAEVFLYGHYRFHPIMRMASMALQNGVSIEAVRGVIIGPQTPMAMAIDYVIAACAK
jgi:hypothetical protein